MGLNLIPPDIYSFLFVGLIGGMGNNALTEPAKMSGGLWTPFTPFIDHYLQIHGAQ